MVDVQILHDGDPVDLQLLAADAASAGSYASDARAEANRADVEADRAEVARAGAEAAEAGTLAALGGGSLSNATLNAASRAVLAALNNTLGIPAYLTESGREGLWLPTTSNISAQVTADPQQGRYVAKSSDPTGASGGWVRIVKAEIDVREFGAVGNGTADDTAAFNAAHAAALATRKQVFWPEGTWAVSNLVLNAGLKVRTAGFATEIKQLSGTAANTRIIEIVGDGVELGSLIVSGRLGLSGDTTGEANDGIYIHGTDLRGIKIGDVRGRNIRGDVVLVANVAQGSIGHIYAEDCYRNGLTVYDGVTGLEVASVVEGKCGYKVVDVEPDNTGADGIRIGVVRGREVQFSGAVGAVDVEIGSMSLDPAFGADPTVAYSIASTGDALVHRGAILKIGRLYINGHDGQAIETAAGGFMRSRISIADLEVPSACLTEAVLNAYFVGECDYEIGQLTAASTLASHRIFSGASGKIGLANIDLATDSFFKRSCAGLTTGILNLGVNGAGSGGYVMSSCTDCHIGAGTIAGIALDGFGSTRCTFHGIDATLTGTPFTSSTDCFASGRINGVSYVLTNFGTTNLIAGGAWTVPGALTANGTATAHEFNSLNSEYRVNGNKVVGARGAALPADATDLTTVIALANAIKARLKVTGGHGLVAD